MVTRTTSSRFRPLFVLSIVFWAVWKLIHFDAGPAPIRSSPHAQGTNILSSDQITVAVLVGSLRQRSINRWLFNAAVELAPANMTLTDAPIGELPLFNDDLDIDGGPFSVQRIRKAVETADALLIITPEYNHSIPGVLKNAIDWLSRPSGRSAILGKPVAVMGAAGGRSGSMRAQMEIRTLFATLNLHALNKPEVIVTFAGGKFDDQGVLTDEETRKLVATQLAAFEKWIHRLRD